MRTEDDTTGGRRGTVEGRGYVTFEVEVGGEEVRWRTVIGSFYLPGYRRETGDRRKWE